ncbi:MAG: putative quinol monooxygenase [Dermatophilaceae bacterium]
MSAFGLIVRFQLKPGQADGFDTLVAQTVAAIRTLEPGTLVYANHTDRHDEGVRVFYELYRDHAAFEAHERTEHTRHFLRERERYVQSHTVTFLSLIEGAGVEGAT